MSPSEQCAKFVASFEGLRLYAYQDGGGVWTIGYGHTAGVKQGDTCTAEQAIAWLLEDLQGAADAVNRLVTVPLNQNQFDALVSFTYNVGEGHLAQSTLLARLNGGNYISASAQFPVWDKIGKDVSAGLLRRRLAERDLFLKAVAA